MSDSCIANCVRNKVILIGGNAWVFIHSGDSVYNVVSLSGSVLKGSVIGDENILPSPEVLPVWCL